MSQNTIEDAIECLEGFGIRLKAEAKSTATAPLRTRQCEIRSAAIFTVLDESRRLTTDAIAKAILLDQYRKALENFGVTFADDGLIRMIPRCDCGVCNTCLHPWNNYPTTYGE